MLQGIYTSRLPVSLVHLYGTYPMPDRHGRYHEAVVMKLSLDRRTTATIGKIGWDNLDTPTVWPLLGRQDVRPEFVPTEGE